ncbi:hypothetical protein [Bacillus tuaregi]|nr:hypothetical protein [Bacillus tuaregi]
MKDQMDQTSAGLNQILEIINAKGDEGELKQIIEQPDSYPSESKEEKSV